jgi:hypothetical protein
MILGMTPFTFVHVVLSLVGIGAGFVVALGLMNSAKLEGWSGVFLATTVLTSVTGFGFPFEGFKPSYVVGAISLIVLAVAIYSRYGARLVGAWRWIYVVAAFMALYLNVFVLVVQAFVKVPALKALAPTQSEPPFLIAQVIVLAVAVIVGAVATIRFRPQLAAA